MQIILNISIVILVFFFMEFVAWFTHKYIMHGVLWYLHKDHHIRDEKHIFEKNDSFFIIFALPSIFCFIFSFFYLSILFYIGLGILLYGFAYFLVHDIFIHQRFKIFKKTNNTYLKALRKAHKVHHKHLTKEDGECFGMLLFPRKHLKNFLGKDPVITHFNK